MNILEQLGAVEEPSIQKFSIYLPNKDKDKTVVQNIGDWVTAAIHVMAHINEGCTSIPAASGAYKHRDGTIEENETVVVYSFIRDPNAFESRFHEIAAFVHRFGQETRQESVLVELSDGHRAYFVDEASYAAA